MKKYISRIVMLAAVPAVVLLGFKSCGFQPRTLGVTADQITIGTSLPLNGPFSKVGQDTLLGMKACFEAVNREGGVEGRRINIVSMDDGYEPVPCENNTKHLIEKEGVFALCSYVGTPTTLRAQHVWKEAKVPLVGLYTGAAKLRRPESPYSFHIRASYFQEAQHFVRKIVEKTGKKKWAIFYQDDAFGEAVKKAVEDALKPYGIEPVVYGRFEHNTVDIYEGLNDIYPKEPEVIAMAGTYKPLAKFVSKYKEAGIDKTLFWTVSFVGSEPYEDELRGNTDNVFVTQVVPPYTEQSLAIIDEYKSNLAKVDSDAQLSYAGLEAYINAKVMVRGLRGAGSPPTREGLISAIENLGEFNDYGIKLLYGPHDYIGSEQVYVTHIKDGKFCEVKDWAKYDATAPEPSPAPAPKAAEPTARTEEGEAPQP